MRILDPAETKQIRELLELRRFSAAAEVLVNSLHRGHSSLRPLAVECSNGLIEEAQSLLEHGNNQAALSRAELALKCMPLEGEGLALLL